MSLRMNLDQARRAYVDEIRLDGGAKNPDVRRALANVPREHFYGPGPWRFAMRELNPNAGISYLTTDDADPCSIYRNASIPLDESRQLLSGHPGLVARYLDQLDIQPGQHVLHLGSGSGYYTALLAELVGPDGRLEATEADARLAALAQVNLAERPNVTVVHTTDAPGDDGCADAILMSFGVTHIEPQWLDKLRDGGRLLVSLTVPIGPNQGIGLLFRVTREGSTFKTTMLQPTAGFSGVGVRDAAMEQTLAQAMQSGAIMQVTEVRRDAHAPTSTCVLHRNGACLSRPQTLQVPTPQALNAAALPLMKF